MLNDEQRASFGRALQALREELTAYDASTREGARPVDLDQPIGRLTRMDAMQQQKLIQANRRRADVRLKQVEAALRRLEAGTYGACVRCQGEIEPERLRARPEAPICLECQEELESGSDS
jgi:DnaK suppressor protein